METNQTDSQLIFSESAEILWEKFEQTGSVQAFLRYTEKVEKIEKRVPLNLPS